MIEIHDALAEQVRDLHAVPDLADVHRRARTRRRRRDATRGVLALAVVAFGVATYAVVRDGETADGVATVAGGASSVTTVPTSVPASVPAAVDVVGLAIDAAADPTGSSPRRGLERTDPGAAQGPWTVVVRRADGSLGRHGAVVTYPAPATPLARVVDVGGTTGGAADGVVVWPVGDGHARVRGDLDDATMLAIARATSIVDGRPVIGSLAGLDLIVVRSAPYRAPVVRELRYGSVEVGESAVLGTGLTYTGVLTGGGFEDQLYAQGGASHVVLASANGAWAVISTVAGGNATIAWEVAPGVIGLVGYSGSAQSATTDAALVRLAGRAVGVDAAGWATFDAQVVEQPNDFGR